MNWTPSSFFKGKLPFELLDGCTLSYSHIKHFGSLAFTHDNNLPKEKFPGPVALVFSWDIFSRKGGGGYMILRLRSSSFHGKLNFMTPNFFMMPRFLQLLV